MRSRRIKPLRAFVLVGALMASACGSGSGAPGAGVDQPAPDGSVQSDAPTARQYEALPPNADLVATPELVAEYVANAPGIDALPDDLRPGLAELPTDTEGTYELGCLPQPAESTTGECIFGDPDGETHVVLYGDSHASMWMPAFDDIGRRLGMRVELLAKPGCPGPDIDFWDLQRNRPYPECASWHQYAAERANASDADIVVTTSAFVAPTDADNRVVTPEVWSTALARQLDRFEAARKIVLGDIPALPVSAPECMAARPSDIQECGAARDIAVRAANIEGDRAGALASGADYIDVTPWFCTDWCSPVVGNIAVYRNQYHASTAYVAWLIPLLEAALAL